MIQNLFNIPIYRATLHRDFKSNEIETYKKIIQEDLVENKENLISKSTKLLNDYEEFSEIKKFIQTHVNQFSFQAYERNYKQKVYITTSWLNLTKPGMSHHLHKHPNSFISGVFYFETLENDSLEIKNPLITNPFFLTSTTGTKYFYDYSHQLVRNADLILFPSWLEHRVPKNETEEDRISLSFNTFIEGKLDSFVNELSL